MACKKISAGTVIDCLNPLQAGVSATIYLANKEDIATLTIDGTNTTLCTNLVMATGEQFYAFEGQLQSAAPKFAMVKGKYQNQFDHEVSFYIFNLSPEAKLQIQNMKDSNLVCIIENNQVGTAFNEKYELYGTGGGLKPEVIERDPNNVDDQGAFKITLKSAEYAREAKIPLTLFKTSAILTETLVKTTLLAPAV